METFQALAQPTRREILRLLAAEEMSVGAVASRFDVTQPAISQHLKVLKDAGLISERRDGTRHLYRVRPEGLSAMQSFLAEIIPPALERLKRGAEEEERAGGARASRN